jgi:hypothetical protein
MLNCIYCGKKLNYPKRKYCNDLCQYRYKSMQKETIKKGYSVRLSKINKRTGRKKIGCSYGW